MCSTMCSIIYRRNTEYNESFWLETLATLTRTTDRNRPTRREII